MGTTASASPKAEIKSPADAENANRVESTSDVVSVRASKDEEPEDKMTYAQTKVAGGVATMIIKVGQEEYMNYDENEQQVTGCLSKSGKPHVLHQQKYVLVQDSPISTEQTMSNSNFMGQPTLLQLQSYLNNTSNQSSTHIIQLRDEPVLYIQTPDDHIPCHLYNVTTSADHHNSIKVIVEPNPCVTLELNHRRKILSTATMTDLFDYNYYDTSDTNTATQCTTKIEAEDDLMTFHEIMSNLKQQFPNIKYTYIPLPWDTLPSTLDSVDDIIRSCMESSNVIFIDCEPYTVRYQFCEGIRRLVHDQPAGGTHNTSLIDKLLTIRVMKYLRNLITDFTVRLTEAVNVLTSVCHDDKKSLCHLLTDVHHVELYWSDEEVQTRLQYLTLLTLFNIYWNDTARNSESFSRWMTLHQELYSCFRQVNHTAQLLQSLQSVLMEYHLDNDELLTTDYLGTFDAVKCANMRKVGSTPIYGIAQPSQKGIKGMLHGLMRTEGHRKYKFVNLRQDPSILINGEPFSLRTREGSQVITASLISASEVRRLEVELKDILANYRIDEYKQIFKNVPEREDITTSQIEQIEIEDVSFDRIPLDNSIITEYQFEEIKRVVDEEMKSELSNPSVIFYCHSGKSRTTMAVSIAALVYYQHKGYPHGAGKGEVERTSVRDAQYTNGHFLIVQRLLSILPNGHQRKREVDFVLDQVFESCSMMHYHIREEIFVTYKKMLKARVQGNLSDEVLESFNRNSLFSLERYCQLILFNTYLHAAKSSTPLTFTGWSNQMSVDERYNAILDEMSFAEFEPASYLSHRITRYLLVKSDL